MKPLAAIAVLTLSIAAPLCAQPVEEPGASPPAFSLASSHVFTTRERPAFFLTFRRVTHLDFRVYRVNDPLTFFAGLRDAHVLGSEEPVVAQERTWLERIARWKADRRDDVFGFMRRQFSHDYRVRRRERRESQQVALRRTVRFTTFAQVPLLNASQLVASWRELLPPVRDAEARRVPLEVRDPGVYLVEAVNPPLRAYTIVIVSDLGLVTKASPGQLLAYAANRFTGEPAEACDVRVLADQKPVAAGATGSDGTFMTELPGGGADDLVAVARCGRQVAATDPGGWFLRESPRELVGYVYTDKPIYRPGHTVRLKAVLRWRTRGLLVPFDRRTAEVAISDGTDKVVYRESRGVDSFGAVTTEFPLPAGAALGFYSIQINSDDQQASGSFEVQEYRKPEYEVIVQPAVRFVVQGNDAKATITARYYFGQPVANASVTYVIHRQPYYSPLRWNDEGSDGEEYSGWYGGEEQAEETGRLDDQGRLEISVPLAVDQNGRDYSVRIEARVTDASSREVSGNTIVHATYGRVLVSAETDRYVYASGTPATLRVRVIDYTGTPQPGAQVNVWLERLTRERGYSEPPTVTRVSESVVLSDAEGRAVWATAMPPEAGDYRFRAGTRVDDRFVQDTAHVWVPGPRETTEEEGDQYLELIADRRSYQPGDLARVVIRGAEFEAPVLITKESQHVSYHRVARARANEALEVPIDDNDVGDTYINIAFLKDDRLFRAEKRVSVPASSRQLQVTIAADQPVSRPRQPGTFTITAMDLSGRPVRAQLSVAVIDEAVYGVKRDETPDPLRFFYRREYSRVGTSTSREYSFIGYSGTQQLLLAARRRPFTLADFKGDRPTQPQVRKEFPDAIYWIADLVTDASGKATIRVAYPDALTTWRLTARAVTSETLVGAAIARTTTTKDLIVRVITPRFLTEGDEAAIPTIVHNYLPAAASVAVTIDAKGVAPAGSGPSGARPEPVEGRPEPSPIRPELVAGRTVTLNIPQAGEQRLDARFKADRVGTATFTSTAVAGADSDAVELSLPVLPYGLKRQTSASGSILDAGERSVELIVPDYSNPGARIVRVSLAPSLAGSLLGALDFLTSYPYGCTEQTLSSFLPNLLVTRALDQLKMAPTERLAALDRQATDGLRRLYDYQHDDGGWGWWKTDENHPFMTAYALYGLLEARGAGYKVQEHRISNGARALVQLRQKYPRAIPDLKAYLVYVLARVAAAGIGVPADEKTFSQAAAIDELWPARDRMTPYGRALLLLTLDLVKDGRGDQLARELIAAAQVEGDVAWWSSGSDPLLGEEVDTSVEATALSVMALIGRDARRPLLEQAVRWLLLNRNAGTYWSSTKQTAMVLYGLLEFMRARGEMGQTFAVDVSVNGAPAGSHTFTAADVASPDPVVIAAPARAGANLVRLVKRGGGALYWSVTAEHFDTRGRLERTGSRKLALLRQYLALAPIRRNDRIVYRETPFGGTAKPGDLLLVRVTAAGSNDWRYLMIEDPLPAGAEPIREDRLYELDERRSTWYGSAREFRDDRVVFFQESFEAGRYEYTYLLKVVTPGAFKAMPAQIAPMYIPDVSASSDPQALEVTSESVPQPGR